jgi:hypothetical protein
MTSCEHCKKKKIGIIVFSCKCTYKNLCSKCRLPSDHMCTYDYKKEWKDKLSLEMVTIVRDKIIKI